MDKSKSRVVVHAGRYIEAGLSKCLHARMTTLCYEKTEFANRENIATGVHSVKYISIWHWNKQISSIYKCWNFCFENRNRIAFFRYFYDINKQTIYHINPSIHRYSFLTAAADDIWKHYDKGRNCSCRSNFFFCHTISKLSNLKSTIFLHSWD